MNFARPFALVASLSLLPMTSCLAVRKSNTSYTGQRVTDAALESVKPGMTADQVRAVLTEPKNVARGDDDSETWTYVAKRHEKEESGLFLIFHNESTKEYEERVFVSFKGAKVVKVWREGT